MRQRPRAKAARLRSIVSPRHRSISAPFSILHLPSSLTIAQSMFLNPLLLACIGGAVVPLVLHLLSRARYRSVDWGAMMFLVGAEAQQQTPG